MANQLKIGFVRRGYSASGGAEAYLKRLARGSLDQGHRVHLYSAEWPTNEWTAGPITHLRARSVIAFADEMEKLRVASDCDVLLSLERIWRCDVYRAGDGVHRAWLERRAAMASPIQKLSRLLNRKHAATLALEESLFAKEGAGRVIANSRMVKEEIVKFYSFPADKIDVVYNGVPLDALHPDPARRARARAALGLADDDIAVLFAGSGWERKGLRFAIDAVADSGRKMRLLVAGRGVEGKFKSHGVRFLGVVPDMPPLYEAADIFLLPTIYDPFSNACLEALAAGLPVITTRANGVSEIIESGRHGTVVDDPRDRNAICDALLFWSDPIRRAQVRVDILNLAARFDIATNVTQTLAILAR